MDYIFSVKNEILIIKYLFRNWIKKAKSLSNAKPQFSLSKIVLREFDLNYEQLTFSQSNFTRFFFFY